VIRVNSQSGKGGVAYLLENSYGVVMPRRLQVEFSGVVQQHTDSVGGEISAQQIWQLFSQTYLQRNTPVCYREYHLFEHGKNQGIRLVVDIHGVTQVLTGYGNGPIEAAVNALHGAGIYVQVRSYEERSMSTPSPQPSPSGRGWNAAEDEGQINVANAQACTFMEMTQQGVTGACYGVGIDSNMISASIKALVSGVNRFGVVEMGAVG
jgi:2-isopropylmalate synthase